MRCQLFSHFLKKLAPLFPGSQTAPHLLHCQHSPTLAISPPMCPPVTKVYVPITHPRGQTPSGCPQTSSRGASDKKLFPMRPQMPSLRLQTPAAQPLCLQPEDHAVLPLSSAWQDVGTSIPDPAPPHQELLPSPHSVEGPSLNYPTRSLQNLLPLASQVCPALHPCTSAPGQA